MSYSLEKQFFSSLHDLIIKQALPIKYEAIIKEFYLSYKNETKKSDISEEEILTLFQTFLGLIQKQLNNPYQFSPYHQKQEKPFDYYTFGLDFFRPLIDFDKSTASGLEHFQEMQKQIEKGENVILLGNHQTETDAIALTILLQQFDPKFAKRIIYVAGERVIKDPLAIPFSLGCDLLCIYSKKYINIDPAKKQQKQMHNHRSMQLLSNLFSEGCKVIYIAPSGGRDRRNDKEEIEVAPFEARSLEMIYLMGKKSEKPCHFYPLALFTYDLLPPPRTTQIEMGEKRAAKRVDIHLKFGPEIDMLEFKSSTNDKELSRVIRAKAIFQMVKALYQQIIKE